MKAYALFFLSIFALQVCPLFLFLIHPLFRPLPESDTPVFRSPSPRDPLRPLGSHTFKDPDPTFPLKATFDISPLNTDDSYVRRPFASRSPCPSIAGASETVLRLQETTRMHSPFGSIPLATSSTSAPPSVLVPSLPLAALRPAARTRKVCLPSAFLWLRS